MRTRPIGWISKISLFSKWSSSISISSVVLAQWAGSRPRTTSPPLRDPLADAKAGILDHMNADHEEALILLARAASGLEGDGAKMTAVDRLGFHVRLTTSEGFRGVRVPFLREVRSSEETRAVLVEMVKRLR